MLTRVFRIERSVHRSPCLSLAKTSARPQTRPFLNGNGPNTILASTQREYFGEQEGYLRVQHTYIFTHILRMGGKSIRTTRLDRDDGAARRVAPEQGPDPKLQNESCRQVSPSQVRDALRSPRTRTSDRDQRSGICETLQREMPRATAG